MRDHLAYLRYVLRHKWFVWLAGRAVGLSSWRGLVHDWSKLLPSEWTPYVHHFYTPEGGRNHWLRDDLDDTFNRAWNYHQKRQPHHWQYWVLRFDDGQMLALPMPEVYVRELVADWAGAGRAITGRARETWEWYERNRHRMLLHPDTSALIERLLPLVSDPPPPPPEKQTYAYVPPPRRSRPRVTVRRGK